VSRSVDLAETIPCRRDRPDDTRFTYPNPTIAGGAKMMEYQPREDKGKLAGSRQTERLTPERGAANCRTNWINPCAADWHPRRTQRSEWTQWPPSGLGGLLPQSAVVFHVVYGGQLCQVDRWCSSTLGELLRWLTANVVVLYYDVLL